MRWSISTENASFSFIMIFSRNVLRNIHGIFSGQEGKGRVILSLS